MDLCGFCLVWLRPRFVLFRCFPCWRNANLAGRFAGRRCCRFFVCSRCFCVSMMCVGCEAKEFHIFCTLFYHFSHCQDRALERDRPQQREKKRDVDASRSRGKIFVIQLLLQSGHCQAQRGAGRIRRLRRTVPFTFRRLEGRLQGGASRGASSPFQEGFEEA